MNFLLCYKLTLQCSHSNIVAGALVFDGADPDPDGHAQWRDQGEDDHVG